MKDSTLFAPEMYHFFSECCVFVKSLSHMQKIVPNHLNRQRNNYGGTGKTHGIGN